MDFLNINMQKILYVILFILILYITKIPIFFKPNGKPREYGIGTDHEGYSKTLYTFQFAIIIMTIFLVVFLN
jgi:hypothetical protein